MLLDKVENIRLSSLSVNTDDTSGIIWNESSRSKLWTTLGYVVLITTVVGLAMLVLQKLREKKLNGQAMEPIHGPKSDLTQVGFRAGELSRYVVITIASLRSLPCAR